jgi:hypothetical protein
MGQCGHWQAFQALPSNPMIFFKEKKDRDGNFAIGMGGGKGVYLTKRYLHLKKQHANTIVVIRWQKIRSL